MTRFFPTSYAGNVAPGTIVLDDLSAPNPYPNFYLLSHKGIKGTSVPTRYVVVHDDFVRRPSLRGMNERELSLTYAHFLYQLCALFSRATKSVSYPAPVYHAHCLAERGWKLSNQMQHRICLYPPPPKGTPKLTIQAMAMKQVVANIRIVNEQFAKLPSSLAWY
eukprot:Protomagalhaensia_wolfi_Nauph_80__3659@NODE_3695_length_733_cov_5_730548_g2910_i0_p1_GENE_NODE_3695_length_733_cov_5_730548_g2910_i0NODE_3695_length_733_cov_5_730548_g2910_i0_p1_ORF_typecomplete_len164_score16_90Piwi/PF02171_17/4e25_NODE_3695_length_733_cov_5_730548_g2910_i0115606